MSISEEERDAIVKYRLEKSNIAIQEAEKVSEDYGILPPIGCIMPYFTFQRQF